MYPRPRCPDRPFSTKLYGMEINTEIHGVPALGVGQNLGSSLIPLREGVHNPWVSLLELTSICLCQFLLPNTYAFLCRILGTRTAPHGGGSPYLRIWRGGRPTVSTMNNCRNGGKDMWRSMRSLRVHRSPAQRGCCMTVWLRSARTSNIRPELV
jgi:hypothetical protein